MLDKEIEKQYKQNGFNDNILTPTEVRRTMVAQDQGFKVERIEERLNWTIDNMGIFPIWLCYIKLNKRRAQEPKWQGHTHIADIGLYGFPTNPNYKCQKTLRAWQLSADAPAAWGDVYLTVKEADRNDEFGPKLKALREKYHGEGAFKNIDDKIKFWDEKEPDLGGPLPYFRFRRNWRYSKPKCLALLVLKPLVTVGSLFAPVVNLVSSVLLFPFQLFATGTANKQIGYQKTKTA